MRRKLVEESEQLHSRLAQNYKRPTVLTENQDGATAGPKITQPREVIAQIQQRNAYMRSLFKGSVAITRAIDILCHSVNDKEHPGTAHQ